jgi:prophage antirepressor-like protein
MNKVTHFDFKSSSVRIVLDCKGEPLFCLADVCKVLNISRTSRLLRELDIKGWQIATPLPMAEIKN